MPPPAKNSPSGTLTLVFTDIQNSTELWEKLGGDFERWLGQHNRILRERLAACGGYEVKTEGDAFMIAFTHARDAVRFALDTQEALHAAGWPPEIGELLVRMGIHTGQPICAPDPQTGRIDYIGPDVNRAARVAGAGHGGQILLSGPTYAAAEGELANAVITDLGEHRLKGLERPVHLLQVLPRSLADRRFAPLDTLTALPTNLPTPTTSFIGRSREIAEISSLYTDESFHLVTITGPGGTGKTRLATQIGNDLLDRFEGGCWFADLTEAHTVEGIAGEVARAFGVPLTGKEAPEQVIANILEYRKPLLLILDNFEHIVQHAGATAGMWRQRAPHLRLLVTSRSRLGLSGEREYELGPLPAPSLERSAAPDLTELRAFDSVALFIDRAREARPGFTLDESTASAVARICAELEGIPLAIELAASRVRILQPNQIASKLGQKFELLKSSRRDASRRQQTLQGTIDWSYDLLQDWEKQAFMQACVFRGGFFLDAAEAVIDLSGVSGAPPGLDAVESLREKSLLRVYDTSYETRFSLYLSIREYGEQKWKGFTGAVQQRALAERHAAHYIAYGESWNDRIHTAGGVEALDRLSLEAENLFTAQDSALAVGDPETAARAILSLADTMNLRGPADQSVPRLERSLAALAGRSGELVPRLMIALSSACQAVGAWDRAVALADEAVELAWQIGINTLIHAAALRQRGRMLSLRGELEVALACFYQSEEICRSLGFKRALAAALGSRGGVLKLYGDFAGALACYEEAAALSSEIADREGLALNLNNRGLVLRLKGDFAEALECYARAEAINRDLGSKPGIALNVGGRGLTLMDCGDFDGALEYYKEAEAIASEIGDKGSIVIHVGNRGVLLYRRGDIDGALQCYAEAEAIARELGDRHSMLINVGNRGLLLDERGDFEGALQCYAEAEAVARELGEKRSVAINVGNRGDVFRRAGRLEEARAALGQAIGIFEELGGKETPDCFLFQAFFVQAEAGLGHRTEAGKLAAETLELAERLRLSDGHPDAVIRESLAVLRAIRNAARC